ncbi:MAG TPA: hypothetical protein VLQ89_00570, partial [Candidatus Binatia bacterium]|nr:hypothetical protein [Candidatus Binatia bacterium]
MSIFKQKVLLQRIGSGLLVFVAVALRSRQFLFNRSLWGDEAMLALNIVNRDFAGIFKPLMFQQSAPLGFLFVEKLLVTIFGYHDFILRLYPFLAGLAAVFVMAWLAKRLFPGWAALVALGLFAFSWQSVYYASEVKQYSSDVLFTLLIFVAAQCCVAAAVPRRNWIWLMGTGTLALWMSHPSLFSLAAVVMVLGVVNLRAKNGRHLLYLLATSLFWAIHFICTYVLSLRYSADSKMLHDYWLKAFMPLPPWNDWGWFARSAEMIFENLLNMPFIPGAALLTVGVFIMFRRNPKTAALWLLPILAALATSALGKYPFWTRFLLFSLPALCFFAAVGIRALHQTVTHFSPKAGYAVSASILLLMLWQPVAFGANKFLHPENKNNIKSIMACLRDNRRSRDTIYVHYASKRPFLYYAYAYGLVGKKVWLGTRAKESPAPLFKNIDRLAGRSRVWFLFANRYLSDRFNHEKIMLKYLDRLGVQRKKFRATGAS